MIASVRRPTHWQQGSIAGLVGLILGSSVLLVELVQPKVAALVLLALLFPFVMMIAGNVQRLLLAIILLEIPIQVDTYLFFRAEADAVGSLGGINLSVTTFCLGLLYALWLAEALARPDGSSCPLWRLSLPPLAYLTACVLSLATAQDWVMASFEVTLLFQTFLLYLYLLHATRTREDLNFLITILLISLSLQSLILIAIRLIGHNLSVASVLIRIDPDQRVGGTVGSPNGAAAYLELLLVPTLSLLLSQGIGKARKVLALVAFVLGTLALLLTFSRGGWLAFAISLALFVGCAWWRGWLSLTVPLLLIGLLLVGAGFFQDAILLRLIGDDRGAAHARQPLMNIAWRMIQAYPFFGVGANNFALVLPNYLTPEFAKEWIYTVHNKYLLIWSETGVLGLLTFLGFLLISIWRGWQGWLAKDRTLSPLALGLTTAIIGQMAHMNVDIFRGRVLVQSLWVVAALVATIRPLIKPLTRPLIDKPA